MNKKMLILVICISLVLVIVVGVVASSILLQQRKVHATSVEITNEEFANGDYIADVTSGEKTLQLTWAVLPAGAENKKVTFSSDNDNFSVSDNGLVTFSKPWEGASITVKTDDGGFTDTVHILTNTTAAQTVLYDFESNSVSLNENANYTVENEFLILFQGVKYFFGDFEIEKNANFTTVDDSNVLTASKVGETALSIKSGDRTNQLKVKIVKQISSISLPKELIALTDKSIVVGNKNDYNFNIIAHSASGAVLPDELEVVYSIQQKNGTGYDSAKTATFANGVHTVDGVVKISDGNKIKFDNQANGKTFKLIVASKYNPSKSASFDFVVNDAHNANSHAELLGLFNDEEIKNINIVNNITVLADGFTMVADGKTYLKINIENDGIYNRKSSMTLEGNNFKIDASNLPLYQPTYGDSGSVTDPAAGDPHFRHSVPALFGLGDASKGAANNYYKPSLKDQIEKGIGLTDALRKEQKEYVLGLYVDAPTFVFNNLSIVGHSGTGLNGIIGTDGKIIKDEDGNVPEDKNNEYLGFSTMNGIDVMGVELSLTNCNITNFNLGIRTSDRSYGIKMKNCKMDDMAGYQVYVRRTANITFEDCSFGQGGHAAVYLKAENSDELIDSFTKISGSGIYGDVDSVGVICNLIGEIKFDNWIDGKDGFFALSTSKDIPNQIKGLIFQTLGEPAFGYLLKDFKGEQNLDDAKFNFGIMSDSIVSDTGKGNMTQMNVGKLNGLLDNYDQDAYYKAMVAGATAQKYKEAADRLPNGAEKDALLKKAAEEAAKARDNLGKINTNPYLAMASVNAKALGLSKIDGMSYFMLGRVDAPTGK